MIKCPTCGREAMEGELVCSDCGTFLRTGGHLRTDPLEESVEAKSAAGLSAPTYDTAPLGAALILKGLTDPREIVVPHGMSTALFGRSDRLAGLIVDFDLSSEDGQTRGVSRRHARVRFVNARYLIEDLESLNGTFLNKRKLVPFVPEVLHHGDELRFGSVTFSVMLKQPDDSAGK